LGRALGICWNKEKVTQDLQKAEVELVFTRRKLFGVTNVVYNPMGFLRPFILQAKKIFQNEYSGRAGMRS